MSSQNIRYALRDPLLSASQIIHKLSKIVHKRMNRNTFFSMLSKDFRTIFHYDRFSIFLYDAEREFLSLFTSPDGTVIETFSKTRIAHNTIAWQAIQSQRPVIIEDISSWMADNSAMTLASAGLNSTIVIPLIVNKDVIGTIHLSFTHTPENIAILLKFLLELTPVLTTFLFVILSAERHARNKAEQQAALEPATTNKFAPQLSDTILETEDMAKVISLARKAAKLHVPILIMGETGTGKSMLARWIHRNSPRQHAHFIKVNCPSLAPTLFESEMFGYTKGAFTGAYTKRIGRVEMAQHGTLFLDEISELSPDMQSKLLQVIEENTFERVGETHSIGADIRIISATNMQLEQALLEGALRRDLFYRISSVIIHLPPLRHRKRDIPLLVDFFINQIANQWTLRPPKLSQNVLCCLYEHSWPGNLRELRNVISRMLLHSLDRTVTAHFMRDLLHEWSNVTPVPSTKEDNASLPTLEENERKHILHALHMTRGRISGPRGAAALLGIPRSTLQHRLRKLDIRIP